MKRTYTIPPEVVREFERVVPEGRRSLFVAEAMASYVADRKRERQRTEIAEGLVQRAEEQLEVVKAFEAVDAEVWGRIEHGEHP